MLHVCLISKQVVPNLIAIMMKWPRHVYLISSHEASRNGITKRFTNILSQLGISTTVRDDAPDSNFPQMYRYANALYKEIVNEHPESGIVLNISGGSKLMAMTFLEAWRKKAHLIQYINMSSNHIEYLPSSADLIIEPVKLDSVLNIPLYLAANGVTFITASSDSEQWKSYNEKRKELTRDMAYHAPEISDLLRIINALSTQARDTNTQTLSYPVQRFSMHPNAFIQKWLLKFEQLGLISWDRVQTIEFMNYESAQYLGGFWLEEYIYNAIIQLEPDDVRSGITISWNSNPMVSNELDVLVVHDNHLLVIECKTLSMGTPKDNEIIYKLDSISDELNGLTGSTLLISAQEPSATIRHRASAQRIKVAGPLDLKYIDLFIKKWMTNQSFLEPTRKIAYDV